MDWAVYAALGSTLVAVILDVLDSPESLSIRRDLGASVQAHRLACRPPGTQEVIDQFI